MEVVLGEAAAAAATATDFPAWLMVNGDRTDRGCSALHHDVSFILTKIPSQAMMNKLKNLNQENFSKKMNVYLKREGMNMVTRDGGDSDSGSGSGRDSDREGRQGGSARERRGEKMRRNSIKIFMPKREEEESVQERDKRENRAKNKRMKKKARKNMLLTTYQRLPLRLRPSCAAANDKDETRTRCKKYTYYLSEGAANIQWINRKKF